MNWNLQEALAYYGRQGAPGDQTALTALLREVQEEHGGAIPGSLLSDIAEYYQIKESFLQAVIRRIPSLKLAGSLSWFHHLKAKVGLEPQTLPAPEDWPPFSNGVEVTLGT